MDSLPPELHSLILDWACASPAGASTARALSLTSTYYHFIAAPFLFHTIVVYTPEQATQLLILLEDTPAPKRQIHRLFVCSGLSASTILRLVQFAAPALRALGVLAPSVVLAAIFRTPFPHLQVLAVGGFYPLPRPGAFPKLTHLHLSGNRSPFSLPAALARACPQLIHLRVSSLHGAPAFARELRAALSADDPERLLLARLETIVLEAQMVSHQLSTHRVAQARDGEMREILLALSASPGKRADTPHIEFSDVLEVDPTKMKTVWLAMACS
ncbi:hypothetical protein B0H11DRAFT_1955680 [Mycena galericulata]|nr:hypothetical protein B0H11DRAFT_1955680 [Mycena galericulata]